MAKEDHTFKRKFVENDTADDSDVQSKLDNFAWEDIDETETESDVPLRADLSEVEECAKIIMKYIVSNINGDHFYTSDEHEGYFGFSIDPSLHPLLPERFSEQWSLESRLYVFQGIREQLAAEADDLRSDLNDLISKALPPRRKKFSFDQILLHDDALAVDDESDTITAEIPVHFELN